MFSDLADRSPRGIAGAVSRAIRAGELVSGDRLPTVRDVAAELGVSPATVSAAWQALRRTGLVTSRGRAGTFVSGEPVRWLSPRQRDLMGSGPDHPRFDLSRGTPDPDLLPALGPALQRVSARAGTLTYQEQPVLPALRDVLVAAWPYDAPSLTVVDGATDAIARVLEQVVGYGDRVVLESPGFPPFYDLVEALGAEVVPVELDGEGIRPASLRAALARKPVAVVLQPRAHNPTGVSTTAARAEAIARVLKRAATTPWVVEDDHCAGISGAPVVTLAEWLPGHVVHVRSYSKSHGPDLRIAAMSGPPALLDPLVARRMLGPGWTSRMVQTILLDLLTSSTPLDEVGEARRQYFARQRTLVDALAAHGVTVPQPDGINLWLPVRDERAAVTHLAAAGIRVTAGSVFQAQPGGAPHVRVTAGALHPEDAPGVAAALAEAAGWERRPTVATRPPTGAAGRSS
ncbi:PLP-dependent aminotransferase family protein [Nocardioides caeni]|uniref:Aminotransferase class I/II-fold pyridoxal phosphate-dependent enzyme n=1 Tax=Nocardioides caeni TaxID=574700 RepID=A0A4S8N6M2_9ACTN|nr:aminotransferase class I/II-fold pyridoxal phosphate-dependent enzyme [Nocardioides caeni]THV10529.1 aminotransferase class I/II-fold pyridoxal phosphate-dependent enzyme [Nocardioides caeni]